MSILDIDEVEKGLEDAVCYWHYLIDKDLANQSSKDIIVKAVDITKSVINNMPDCCKREIELFYGYHKEEGTGLQIDRENEPQHTDEQRFYYPSDDKFYETYQYPILGEYYPNDKMIILYLKAIENAANNKYKIEYLIATVLIHELMHAIMDTGSMYGCYPANSLYAFWKEESCANALTLLAIRNYTDKKLAIQAEIFMESQPDPYRYGVYLANNNSGLTHTVWKDEKNNGQKPIEEQKQWLDNAMMDICTREDVLEKSFNDFWNDILNTNNNDYYSKMTIEHFINIKKGISNINNIITLKVTLAFVDFLLEKGIIGKDDAKKMKIDINKTSANANGYDIKYDNDVTDCHILAEIKCNIPVKNNTFGAAQIKGILEDINGLEKGKEKGGVSDTSNYQRFMVFLDTGDSIRNAVKNLLIDKFATIDNVVRNNKPSTEKTHIVFIPIPEK